MIDQSEAVLVHSALTSEPARGGGTFEQNGDVQNGLEAQNFLEFSLFRKII